MPPAALMRPPKPGRRERRAAEKARRAAEKAWGGARPIGVPGRPPPPPPPRRRRRWFRKFLLVCLLGALCCCGVPAWYGWPITQQYPVTAVPPATVADLSLRDDAASRRTTAELSDQVREAHVMAEGVFAAVYSDGRGKRVTVSGATGLRLTPESDVDAELSRVGGDYGLAATESFDPGVAGLHVRCGTGRIDGTAVTVCGWADFGSVATATFTRRSVADSAQLVHELRAALLTRS
jgi:hypothetical protein